MESDVNWHNARALLEWQLEMGVNENILDAPIDRFALDTSPYKTVKRETTNPGMAPKIDPVAIAQKMSQNASSLDELRSIIGAFEYCELNSIPLPLLTKRPDNFKSLNVQSG